MTAKTVRVRIAVAVIPNGEWACAGWSTSHSAASYANDAFGRAVDSLESGEARYWIEADIPIPETQTIAGTVTLAESEG